MRRPRLPRHVRRSSYWEPVTGLYPITVRLYDECSGGNLLFEEGFSSVPVTKGALQVVLGKYSDHRLPDSVKEAVELWVETDFNGNIFQRQIIGTAPRALSANNAAFSHGLEFDYITVPTWRAISPGEVKTITHSLGGDPSRYY